MPPTEKFFALAKLLLLSVSFNSIMAQVANLALDRGDPRLHEKEREAQDTYVSEQVSGVALRPQHRKLHDRTVTFEEYHYYAKQTRAEEDMLTEKETGVLSILFPSKNDKGVQLETKNVTRDASTMNTSSVENRRLITDEEWINASRALRTASRGAIFYLITTDILGPFGLPYAFASMGWG